MKTIAWIVPISKPETGECEWHNYMNRAGWPIVYCAVEPNTIANETSLKKIKEKKPDLIFATSDSVVEAAVQLKTELKIPLVMYVWGYPPERIISWLHSEWLIGKLKKLNQADYVLGCSNYTSRQLSQLGVSTSTLYPGINCDTIESLRIRIENFQGTSKGKPRILAIARLVEHKRLDMIVTAISCLPKPRPKLLILGWGAEFNFLRRLAVRSNVDVEIRQQKNDEEKFLELLSPDTLCLVTASRYEGFGLVPVEAMFCKKRVIVSDIPAHREVLMNHANYFSGINELIIELTEILKSPANPERIEKAYDFVFSHYTWTAAVQNMAIMFRDKFS